MGQPSILLRTQYRCHPNIAQVANYLFYENYLEDGVKKEQRKRLLKRFQPITFISAEKGLESKSEFSYRNYYEAKFILALIDYLTTLIYHKLNKTSQGRDSESSSQNESSCENQQEIEQEGQVAEGSIGVILTYKSQVDLINQLIFESPNRALKDV